jgi:hypothetical protein
MSNTKENINIVHNLDDKIDKSLILNRIKSYYHLKKKADLARFLGIESNTLSNWYTRNIINFDLILTKCDAINPNWLINGLGNPAKNYINLEEISPSNSEDEKGIYTQNFKQDEIERLNQIIIAQDKTIAAQARTIELMELLITKKD